MKYALIFILAATFGSINIYAHDPFELVSKTKFTFTEAELAERLARPATGKADGNKLTFTEKEIQLTATIGPAEDMLSYRIQGLRNPTLVVPADAVLRVLFINTDAEMKHDIYFGHSDPPFELLPDTTMSFGTSRLDKRGEDGKYFAEELVIKAVSIGEFNYFCSARGHARNGMWGNIAIGTEPKERTAETEAKAEHKHGNDANDAEKTDHSDHAATNDHDAHQKKMRSTVDLNDPMTRESSGTSWVPDSSPMYAYTKMYKDGGMLMLMGSAFVRHTTVGSSRDISVAGKGGRSRVDAPNMFMAMYSRPLSSKSQLGLRVMASLDPVTQRGWGYPLLYQSGELYQGQPIHDRQHPHDFISELAASYSYQVKEDQSVYVYGGIAGEPALGPPMFMHRPSGMNNPDAPISHHWQDASHITWGVITAGYNFKKFKVEASVFNGTEPDENRWAFDSLRLNSYSGRFSFSPTKDLTFQVSHAYLKRPERAEPDLDHMRRTTASVIYNKRFSEDTNWASTFVWGQNYKEKEFTNAFLFESDYTFGKNAIFGRVEQVQKDGHELVIPHSDPIHNNKFVVGVYSLGYVRDIVHGKGIDVGLGGMLTGNTNPAALTPYYGGTRHGGWQLFVRFRPSRMKH